MGLIPPRGDVLNRLMVQLLDRGYSQATAATLRAILSGSTSGMVAQRLNDLDAEVARLLEAGERLTANNPVLRAVLADFDAQMKANAALLNSAAGGVQQTGINAAGEITRQLALPGLTPAQVRALGIQWNVPNPEAVARVVDYTGSEAWRDMLTRYQNDVAQAVQNTALRGIVAGQGPLQTARDLRRAVENLPAFQANSLMRTLQLTSYRDAAVLHRVANADILDYQIRVAALDDRTCFPAGTLVQTEGGFKQIQDVTVGDRVLTDKGHYQPVHATMQRVFVGKFVSLKTNTSTLITTYDHPILIRRDGNCHWVPAESVQIGDQVFISREYRSYDGNHRRGDVPVKRDIGHADNSKALSSKPSGFLAVGLRTLMPVNAVNLKRDIEARNMKINGVTVKRGFLNKWFIQVFKAKPNAAFRSRFTLIAAIANRTAKLLIRHRRNNAKRLTTRQTSVDSGRSSAKFRAIVPLTTMNCKHFSATFTSCVFGVNGPTLATTNGIAISIGQGNSERFSADGTGFSYRMRLIFAFSAAIARIAFSNLRGTKNEVGSADLTGECDTLTLSETPANGAAIRTVIPAFSKVRFPDIKGLSADNTDSFYHEDIISTDASLIKSEVMVFNLEVEDDHTYTANGMVVHNCPACVALHGTRLPLDARIDDHYNGRCTSITVIKGRAAPDIQTGAEWFAGRSEAQQRAQLGGAAYEAWKAGAVQLSDFAHKTTDDVFGPQVQAASLKGILGKQAQQYYAR